jgi:hypothetical protein
MWEEYYSLLEKHAAGRILSDQARRQLKQVGLTVRVRGFEQVGIHTSV